MQEVIVNVKGLEGYYVVSNMGWYARLDKDLYIKEKKYGHPGARGELRAPLYMKQQQVMWQMSRLVAAHFLPDWDPNCQVEHKDGDRTNNRADNLRMSAREAH